MPATRDKGVPRNARDYFARSRPTRRQAEIFALVVALTRRDRRPPTRMDLVAELGLSGASAVQSTIRSLVARKLLTLHRGKVTLAGETCPCCQGLGVEVPREVACADGSTVVVLGEDA